MTDSSVLCGFWGICSQILTAAQQGASHLSHLPALSLFYDTASYCLAKGHEAHGNRALRVALCDPPPFSLIQDTLKAPTKCLFFDHILKVDGINDSPEESANP